jgi:hypothetical protein
MSNKIKLIDNAKINEIYASLYCVENSVFKWKKYRIKELLDCLQRYNKQKWDESVEKIDVYYAHLVLEHKVYDGAFDDFKKLVYENVLDEEIGHADFRLLLKNWFKHYDKNHS